MCIRDRLPDQTNEVGTAITPVQIVATDNNTGEPLTYAATGLPAGLSIHPATGLITGTPTAVPGDYPVTVLSLIHI